MTLRSHIESTDSRPLLTILRRLDSHSCRLPDLPLLTVSNLRVVGADAIISATFSITDESNITDMLHDFADQLAAIPCLASLDPNRDVLIQYEPPIFEPLMSENIVGANGWVFDWLVKIVNLETSAQAFVVGDFKYTRQLNQVPKDFIVK